MGLHEPRGHGVGRGADDDVDAGLLMASSARSTCVKSKTPGWGSSVLHVDSAMRTTLRLADFIIATSVAMRSCGMYSS